VPDLKGAVRHDRLTFRIAAVAFACSLLAIGLLFGQSIAVSDYGVELARANHQLIELHKAEILRDGETIQDLQHRVLAIDAVLDRYCKALEVPCPPPLTVPRASGSNSTATPAPSESRASPSGEPTATPSPKPLPTPVLCIGSFCIG
jgi:hypothetical protein